MELSANVKLHVIVPDTDPFILFGVEILTEYSRSIITKRFTDMSRFQNNLCYFAHTSCGQGKVLMDLLPTLPYPQPNLMSFSDSAIRERKEKVARYFKVLCELYNLYAHDQKLPWVKMIRQFINLDQIELKQKKAAIVIQRYYKKYLCKLALQEKTHDMYMAKGYVGKLEAIPDCLLIYTFSFLELKDFLRIAIVNKRWGQISEQPILWISLNLFQSKIKIEGVRFQMICQRAWRLKVIDLRYCQFINSESLRAISQYCNPESLKELLLDGCENIDDCSLLLLCSSFPGGKPQLKGGARGLTRLSLAECRALSNHGVAYLGKLKFLEDLNVLGCYSISDEGIELLALKAKSLKKLNLSGTYISRDGLNAIHKNCKNIETLILHGCRLLSQDDISIFPKCYVELRDDIFRFQLLPTTETELSSITNNILRTRSSLTVQRVAHYVYKKLQQEVCNIDIICKDIVLSSYMTLREVENDLWDNTMLTLHYRLKSETIKILENRKVENLMGKMPKWVQDETVEECFVCHTRFWMLLRKHHCRKCGNVICKNCSEKKIFIPAYGYTKSPVRVCDSCFA